MTHEEYLTLLPGSVLRAVRGRRLLRVVVTTPCVYQRRNQGCVTCIGLVKISKSWTSPHNPTAWYDACFVRDEYEVTGRVVRLQPHVRRWLEGHLRSRTW